jgi:hypothetical protein
MKANPGRMVGELLLVTWPFLLPGIILLFVCSDALFYGFTPWPFSQDAWARGTPDERGYMLADLIRNHPLENRTEDDVRELLGSPDEAGGSTWSYRIGYRGRNPNRPFVFPYKMHVRFSREGRVVEVYEDD